MAILSQEVNRFLGNALLDTTMLNSIFSGERDQALQGFNLQPAERNAILASKARTLMELSQELTTTCSHRDTAGETDAVLDKFYQSVHGGTKRATIHMESVAQRIINSLPGQSVANGVAATTFAKFQAAS